MTPIVADARDNVTSRVVATLSYEAGLKIGSSPLSVVPRVEIAEWRRLIKANETPRADDSKMSPEVYVSIPADVLGTPGPPVANQ
jgi:hypothetical protein